MKTTLAYGRFAFPMPSISASNDGVLPGGGNTYYFWVKARNRAGYNQPSTVKSLEIPNSGKITIASSTFNTFSYEDWREIIVCFSTTNNFADSRVIYKQELYDEDNIAVSLSNVVLNKSYLITNNGTVAEPADLPTDTVPNGYRNRVTSLNNVYEFRKDDVSDVDGIFILAGSGGNWHLVPSNSLTETGILANVELFQLSANDYKNSKLDAFSNTTIPLKYYIINDSANPVVDVQIALNEYFSHSSVLASFEVEILGYLDFDTYTLDTTGIDYVNTIVNYPETRPTLNKNLSAGDALVIQVKPVVLSESILPAESYISIYPSLTEYRVIDQVLYWDDPVADIASLSALNPIQYKNNQVRYVISKNKPYRYDAASTATADGDSIVSPNGSPAIGRWLSTATTIGPGSVTLSTLSEEVLEAFSGQIKTTTVTISSPTNYTINLDSSTFDYYILVCPNADVGNTPTIINLTKTMPNNSTVAVVLELRQKTGIINFDSSIIFPNNTVPVLSGNNKTDIVVVTLVKDGAGTLKKRAYLAQSNVG